MTPEDEELEAFLQAIPPPGRIIAGMVIFRMAERLDPLSAESIAVVGTRMVAIASGWTDASEIKRTDDMADVEAAFLAVLDRMAAARAWEEQFGDGGDEDG